MLWPKSVWRMCWAAHLGKRIRVMRHPLVCLIENDVVLVKHVHTREELVILHTSVVVKHQSTALWLCKVPNYMPSMLTLSVGGNLGQVGGCSL